MNKRNYIKLIIITFLFVILQVILSKIVTVDTSLANVQWWIVMGDVMKNNGFFNVWTAYPPFFPILFYFCFLISKGNANIILGLWPFFNIILISLISFLIFKIVYNLNKKKGVAFVTAFGYFIINLSWKSAVLVGINSDQFDYLPTLMMVLALYFLLKDKISSSSIFSALGCMTKIFPAILLPIAFFQTGKRKKVKYLLIFILVCIIIVLPFLIINPKVFLSTFYWSSSRYNWETVWTFPEKIYPPVPNPNDFVNPMSHVIKTGGNYLFYIALVSFLLTFYFLRNKIKDNKDIIKSSLILLSLLLIVSKGISSYFILWIMPLISLVYVGVSGFVILFFLIFIANLEFVGNLFWVSIFARHFLLLGLFIHQIRLISKKYKLVNQKVRK